MEVHPIFVQLKGIASGKDFPGSSAQVVDTWQLAGVGIESVEPILAFMEENPGIDFGAPGALVHFVETFHGSGYEQRLAASLKRRPTSITVWMLNRVINGTRTLESRRFWIEEMQNAGNHVLADSNVRLQITHFLKSGRCPIGE